MTKSEDLSNLGGGFIQSGIGAVQRAVESKLKDVVSVKDFGAVGDGVTDDTAAIQACQDSLEPYQTMYFPPGIYIGKLFVTKENINVLGAGSGSSILKMKAGVDGNVIQIGSIDAAIILFYYTGNVQGLTLDGNRANTPSPALAAGSYDYTGWGLAVAYAIGGTFTDIRGINCWNGGLGFFLCDYIRADGYAFNCGFNPNLLNPGVDTNGCKYSQFRFTIKNCNQGGRCTDATYGCTFDIVAQNCTLGGFASQVQAVVGNYTEGNTVNLTAIGGCSQAALAIGGDVSGCTFNANILRITGIGVVEGLNGPFTPTGNTYNITTKLGNKQSGTFAGTKNTINAKSLNDAQGSTAGTYFAYEITGSYNIANLLVQADATPLIRGITLNGNFNVIKTFERNTLES